MKVLLEEGVWLTKGVGDPPRTIVEAHAAEYDSAEEAYSALTKALKYRKFKNPLVVSNF